MNKLHKNTCSRFSFDNCSNGCCCSFSFCKRVAKGRAGNSYPNLFPAIEEKDYETMSGMVDLDTLIGFDKEAFIQINSRV